MSKPVILIAAVICLLLLPVSSVQAQKQADYYQIETFNTPEGEVLELGAFEQLPDGRLAVSTRRGDIWMISNALKASTEKPKWTLFARGLHEVLGLAWKENSLYATQRGEITKITDTNNDGEGDRFETYADGWGITGDYHEYAFTSKFDTKGDLWLTLCLTGSFSSQTEYRGWCLRITPEGKVVPTCSGIRSPGGMGMNLAGDVFYTDNQGPWNGTCGLKHLSPGKFVGHPGGFKWYDLPAVKAAMGNKPQEPESGSRFMTEAGKIPEYEPAAILFPYKKMGQSASGIDVDRSEGKFGPFAGQLFVGDQTQSTLMRCDLEQVDGHYQGACFPFMEGFGSGTLAVQLDSSGIGFVGGTNRGWGSTGNKPFAVERIRWTGKLPFEVKTMRATPTGFRLTFTKPVDPASVQAIENYELQTYTYIYQASYGSPEVDHTKPTIKQVQVSDDHLSAELLIDGLQVGHIHELISKGVKSAEGETLLHPEAYYTLNRIPAK